MSETIALIVLYMLPTVAALARGKKSTASIAIVNLFLGWTFIGWVICLAWAVKEDC